MSKFGLICFCVLLCASSSYSGDVSDTLKSGLNKVRDYANIAYDGIHCQFHKIKEAVSHHEHDVDPCMDKSQTTTTTTTTAGSINIRHDYGRNDYESVGLGDTNTYRSNEPAETPKPYGWQT